MISEWLLKAFSVGADELVGFDKKTGAYERHRVDEFLVQVNSHASEVEAGLSAIETPASRAAQTLSKRVKGLPPGLYAVVAPGDDVVTTGGFFQGGSLRGMQLLVAERQIPSPAPGDRTALATFMALMYQRSPKTVAGKVVLRQSYQRGADAALAAMVPSLNVDTTETLAELVAGATERAVATAANLGPQIAASSWFVARADSGQTFVLGDSPVATTPSLGFDGKWQPLLGPAAFVIVMPIGPSAALVVAPKVLMPVFDTGQTLTTDINRLIWRWADRYVLAASEQRLDAAWSAPPDARQEVVNVDLNSRAIALHAYANTCMMIVEVLWRRFEHCRLVFGFQPFDAEDRHRFTGPGDHIAPILPGPSPGTLEGAARPSLRLDWPAGQDRRPDAGWSTP